MKTDKVTGLFMHIPVLLSGIALLFSGCEHVPPMDHAAAKKLREARMLKETPIIDKDAFVKEARVQHEKNAEHGPALPPRDETSRITERLLRDKYNVRLNQDDPFKYTKLHTKTAKKRFPVKVNVRNMDINDFIAMMSELSSVNMLVAEEVKGVVSARLDDVPWDQALESVLKMKGLAKHIEKDSGIIRIHRQETIAQLDSFERQRRTQEQQALQLARASEPLYTEVYKLFYTKPQDVKDIIQGVIAPRTGAAAGASRNTEAQITIDERRNLLLVKARQEDLVLIQKLIEEIDTRTKQVFIEAFIVEVSEDFAHELGTRLGINGSEASIVGAENFHLLEGAAGVSGAGTALGLGVADQSAVDLAVGNPTGALGFLLGLNGVPRLKVELSALENEGLSRVIANPRIFTLDNKEAVIFQGDQVPFETSTDLGLAKIEFRDAGLKLLVTPSVIGDGNLLLSIAVNKDTLKTSDKNPTITKSEIKTNLVTRDRDIVVIGGIYTQTNSGTEEKVPGLGDIPGAGRLFRKDRVSDSRKELMIFIAPRVI